MAINSSCCTNMEAALSIQCQRSHFFFSFEWDRYTDKRVWDIIIATP